MAVLYGSKSMFVLSLSSNVLWIQEASSSLFLSLAIALLHIVHKLYFYSTEHFGLHRLTKQFVLKIKTA